jgi:Flp pilus assembly protein TadG
MMRRIRAREQNRPVSLPHRQEGTSLIEFALVFPILVMMFLGLVEFGEAFAVDRKLTNAASAVSDLVAQTSAVTGADLDDLARAAEEIVKPYASAQLRIVVTSVETDRDGASTVGWSYAHGSGATTRQSGSSFTLPQGLAEPNSSVIVTETSYSFAPSVGLFLTGTINLSGEAFFRPRLSSTVALDD